MPLADADRLAAAFADGYDCGCEILVPFSFDHPGYAIPGKARVVHTCGKQREVDTP